MSKIIIRDPCTRYQRVVTTYNSRYSPPGFTRLVRSKNSTYLHLGFRKTPLQEKPFLYSSTKLVTEHLRHLSHPAVACYLVIAAMVNVATQMTSVSLSSLENLTGFSRDSVIRGVKELKEKGLIYVVSFCDGVHCNIYALKSLVRPSSLRGLPRHEKPFMWVSKHFVTDMYLRDLPGAAVKVYLCIACAENSKNRNSRISHKKIAEWSGMSVSTVTRAIKALEKFRLIVVYTSTTSLYCNEYRLLSFNVNVTDSDINIRGSHYPPKQVEGEDKQESKKRGSRTSDNPTIELYTIGRLASNDFDSIIISASKICLTCFCYGLAQLLCGASPFFARLRSLIDNVCIVKGIFESFRTLHTNFVLNGHKKPPAVQRHSESWLDHGGQTIETAQNSRGNDSVHE